MANLLSEIPEDFLIRVMAFEKALQEKTREYSYFIYNRMNDDEEAEQDEKEPIYVGEFSMVRTGVNTCVRIMEFDTHMLAEGISNDWILDLKKPEDFIEVMNGASEFKYAGVKLTKEGCWYDDELLINLEYHLPVVDEYCCDAEGYAQMILEAFTLFKAEAFIFQQKMQKLK